MADEPPYPKSPGDRDDSSVGAGGRSTEESTPRWVYWSGIILIVMVLLLVLLHLVGGGHEGHNP